MKFCTIFQIKNVIHGIKKMNNLNIEVIKLCVGAISTIQKLKYDANNTSEYEIISRLESMVNKLCKYEYTFEPFPIESAPKDGTVIDIFNRNGRATDVYWNPVYDSWSNGRNHYSDATHWLPIPQVKGE